MKYTFKDKKLGKMVTKHLAKKRTSKRLVNWRDLTLYRADMGGIELSESKRREAFREYRRRGTILGYYLADPETTDETLIHDAGPSPNEIDWTGLN